MREHDQGRSGIDPFMTAGRMARQAAGKLNASTGADEQATGRGLTRRPS